MAYKIVYRNDYLMHYNKNHDPKNGRFTFGDGDNDGVVDDHAHRRKEMVKNLNPAYAIKTIKKAKEINSTEYKKNTDTVIRKGTKTQTLAFDEHRLDDADMFYATYHPMDNKSFRFSLSGKMMRTLYDEDGNEIGTGLMSRNINLPTTVTKDIKVASEKSSAEAFADMYKKDKDFRDFILNNDRLSKYFDDAGKGFTEKTKEYKEARSTLDRIKKDPKNASDADLNTIYRLFNYVIPYDGGIGADANPKGGEDVYKQRTKFFKKLKDNGYGACLDLNDAIYTKQISATNPVIIFDMEKVVKNEAEKLDAGDRAVGYFATLGRKVLGW